MKINEPSKKINRSANNKISTESLELAKTDPMADGPAPDANVGAAGHCTLTETAEQTRPDSGEPCRDGRDGL